MPPQNDLVALMLESALEIVPHLVARHWAVVKFPDPGLVTRDRPVLLYQHPENRKPLLGVRIATADELLVRERERASRALSNLA